MLTSARLTGVAVYTGVGAHVQDSFPIGARLCCESLIVAWQYASGNSREVRTDATFRPARRVLQLFSASLRVVVATARGPQAAFRLFGSSDSS